MRLTTVILLLVLVQTAWAQRPGPFYKQFFFNPYAFNPAFAGINNQAEMNLTYRKQWIDFQDAPVTAGLNVQLPASQRIALGFNLYTDKQVLLRNSSFMASFVYVVPIADKQTIRFGLSGGIGMNALNLDAQDLNTNDPVITRAINTSYYADGNFGIVYTAGPLKLGFAFTDILSSNSFTSEKFNSFKFSNLKNRLYSASYQFSAGMMNQITIEPYVLYHQSEDGAQDFWEAASLVYFKESVWTGVSYNQQRGVALFLGLKVKDKFSFSYSYEFPPVSSTALNASSHELGLNIKLGRKRAIGKPIQKGKATVVYESRVITPSESAGDDVEERRTKDEQPGEVKYEEHIPDDVTLQPDTSSFVTPGHHTILPQEQATLTYYVVVGSFRMVDHAVRMVRDLLAQGYFADIVRNTESNYYYVYIFTSTGLEEARRNRNQYRMKTLFREAWIYTR